MAVEALRRELELEEQAISQHTTPVEEVEEEVKGEEVEEEVVEEEKEEEVKEKKEEVVKEKEETKEKIENTTDSNDNTTTEKPSKKKNKRQKRRVIEMNTFPEETAEGEMSVLEMIEQMNNQNMTGRKAKNMNRSDAMPSKKKGKKGKNK